MNAPQPREYSHPVLWAVGLLMAISAMGYVFFHWLEVGRRMGRDDGEIQFATHSVAKPVDHRKLIDDRSVVVIDRGEQVYQKNCVSCHGVTGDPSTGATPNARNFRKDAYRAEWGGGPFGFYQTLTKGSGSMPPFANLSAEDRYAVAHFVRESWQKGTALYIDKDPVHVQIPAPGAGSDVTAQTPPHLVPQAENLHAVLAVVAAKETARIASARTWIGAAGAMSATNPSTSALIERVVRAGQVRPGWLLDLHGAAALSDRAKVASLLLAETSGDPALAMASSEALEAVAIVLIKSAVQRT